MKNLFRLALIAIVVMVSSCGEYEKLLKSNDYELKYQKALEYYNTKEYVKSTNLIEQILPRYRATSKADTLLYYQAYGHYNQHDYIMAGHYFREFSTVYNNSAFTEECDFMGAYCHYKLSPKAILDQTSSYSAISAFQLFMAKYPNSEKKKECRDIIFELRNKLVYKSYKGAKLYYDLESYKAAIVSLRNSLKDFPDTEYREEIVYLIVKSNFELAEKSVESKKIERYQSTVDEYYSFISEFPESEHMKEVEKIFAKANKMLSNK